MSIRTHKFKNALVTHRILLSVILLTGLGLRLSMWHFFPDIPLRWDSGDYYSNSIRLAEQGIANWHYINRAPGYFFFLSGSFLLSGNNSIPFVRGMQSLVSTATIAFVYALTLLSFRGLAHRHWVALAAAALIAFYPDHIFFSNLFWTETLFVFLTLAGLVALLKSYRQDHSRAWLFGAGILLALATLTRELLFVFAVVLVPLWLWLVSFPKHRAALARISLYGLAVGLVVLPWMYRNYEQGYGIVLISSQQGQDIWRYNALFLIPGSSQSSLKKELPDGIEGQALNELGLRWALELIAKQPGKWALAKTNEVAKIWTDAQSNIEFFGVRLELISRSAMNQWEPWLRILWLIVLSFIVIGLLVPGSSHVKLLFAFFLVGSMVVFFATYYTQRFRLGLMFPFFPYAALGLYTMGQVVFSRQRNGIALSWQRVIIVALVLGLMYGGYMMQTFAR